MRARLSTRAMFTFTRKKKYHTYRGTFISLRTTNMHKHRLFCKVLAGAGANGTIIHNEVVMWKNLLKKMHYSDYFGSE